MKRQAAVLATILMVISRIATAQSTADTPAKQGLPVSPFIGQDTSIPEGYSMRLSAAYSPYDRKTNFAYGNIAIGIAGLLEATIRHEGAIGSPTGLLEPATLFGLRLQIVPQRERFPAVSVFLNTMSEAQSNYLGGNDLSLSLPDLFQRGVKSITFEARTTVAGVALATRLNDVVSFSASLGGREMVWRQGWSDYSVNTGIPSTPNGTPPTPERSRLRLDWSASVSLHPLDQLAVIGEVGSLPFIDIDPSSLLIEARQGLVGTIGVRYSLPIPLSVELYDRWYSETRERTNYHQVRIGLSTEVLFQ